LTKLTELSRMLKAVVDRIHACGSNFPSHEQVKVLGTHALLGSVMGTIFQIQHLAPSERRSVSELIQNWAAAIERNDIVPLIGPAQDEAA
jgi:hypothetical protein